MNIIIKSKNIEITPSLQVFIEKKMNGFKKFLGVFEHHSLPVRGEHSLFDTFVEVKKETKHHRKGNIFTAEIKLALPGRNLFAKATGEDVIKIVNEARDEMEREIRKYKAKMIEAPRRKSKKLS